MTHPTYDKSDPKAGQPVLIGEKLWNPRTQAMSTVAWIDANGMPVLDDHDALFPPYLSTPPAPAIEACYCGAEPEEVSEYRGIRFYQLQCKNCGRRSILAELPKTCIASWNADMLALKAAKVSAIPGHEFIEAIRWAAEQLKGAP